VIEILAQELFGQRETERAKIDALADGRGVPTLDGLGQTIEGHIGRDREDDPAGKDEKADSDGPTHLDEK
jgi:hypothetical protein